MGEKELKKGPPLPIFSELPPCDTLLFPNSHEDPAQCKGTGCE